MVPSCGVMVNSSRTAAVLILKLKPTSYLPVLEMVIVFSLSSSTRTRPKSMPEPSPGNLTSTSIL